MATINLMPQNRKPAGGRKADRHKPAKQYRVPMHLSDLLEKVADREYTTPSAMLVAAIKMLLREKGELPPPAPPSFPPNKPT